MKNLLKMIIWRLLIILVATPFTAMAMLCVAGLFLFMVALLIIAMPICAIIATDEEIEKFYQ